MTDAEKEIREALAAGPTPGEWFAVNDGTRGEPFMNVKAERISGRGPTHEVAICATGDSPQSMETANARYIAACHPAAIRELLAERDALAGEVKRRRQYVELYDEQIMKFEAEIDRLRAENEVLREIERDMSNALPGVYYMDPPDGGSVPLGEQVRRMAVDAARYRWLRGDSCPDHSSRWTQWEVRCWKAPSWTGDLRRADLDDAIDAARGKE